MTFAYNHDCLSLSLGCFTRNVWFAQDFVSCLVSNHAYICTIITCYWQICYFIRQNFCIPFLSSLMDTLMPRLIPSAFLCEFDHVNLYQKAYSLCWQSAMFHVVLRRSFSYKRLTGWHVLVCFISRSSATAWKTSSSAVCWANKNNVYKFTQYCLMKKHHQILLVFVRK